MTALAAIYDAAHNSNVADPVYDPTQMSLSFADLMTIPQKNALTGGIKVWTESQLLNGIGAGLLKTVSSTQTNIETPVINANNIDLHIGGNVGSIALPVEITVPVRTVERTYAGPADRVRRRRADGPQLPDRRAPARHRDVQRQYHRRSSPGELDWGSTSVT